MLELLLFTLNAPTNLKDEIIDRLMSYSNITGFNLKAMNGYSKEHSLYNVSEQVEGYRPYYQFEVLITASELNELKRMLKPICEPAKLKYWLIPVIESDHF